MKNKLKSEAKKCKNELRSKIQKIKNDILTNKNECSDEYKILKDNIRKMFPENTKVTKSQTLIYSIHKDPIKFLPMLIKMSNDIVNKGQKTFNCFPLRTEIKPKYITLDTVAIIYILFPDKLKKKGYYLTDGNTKKYAHKIWNFFFKIDKKFFTKKKYRFHYQISTDGVGCSILLIRNDLYDPIKTKKIRNIKKPKNYREDMFVSYLNDNQKNNFKNYSIIGIDPGKDDLIYATNGDTKVIKKQHETRGLISKHVTTTFRYSQNQRRKETKVKKYAKIIETDKKKNKFNNNSVKELETQLSEYNSKDCLYKSTKNFIKKKNEINSYLLEYYEKKLYRKLKWYGFINRQRSEANMLKRFRKIFGDYNNTLVCMGDYGQKCHMKFKEPTKGKGLRKLFKSVGYNVLLVDEYNSSCRSFITGEENEKFRERINPRPWKTNVRKQHGLLRTKYVPNNKSKCILTNRDFNGSMNILKRAHCTINNLVLPTWLKRKKEEKEEKKQKKQENKKKTKTNFST